MKGHLKSRNITWGFQFTPNKEGHEENCFWYMMLYCVVEYVETMFLQKSYISTKI
jgi:hypothetical protein